MRRVLSALGALALLLAVVISGEAVAFASTTTYTRNQITWSQGLTPGTGLTCLQRNGTTASCGTNYQTLVDNRGQGEDLEFCAYNAAGTFLSGNDGFYPNQGQSYNVPWFGPSDLSGEVDWYPIALMGGCPSSPYATPNAPPVPWCSTSDFGSPVGSYSGGQLAVRFKWLNAALPSAGWSVQAPDSGSSSTAATATMPKTATVDGQPGWFYFTVAVTADAAMTARVVAPDASSSSPGCYVSIALASNPISSTPPSTPDTTLNTGGTGDSTSPDTGLDCGAWWHIVCHIKAALHWAFVPSTSGGDLKYMMSNLQGKAPWSFVLAGPVAVSDILGQLNNPNRNFGEVDVVIPGGDPNRPISVDPFACSQPQQACDSTKSGWHDFRSLSEFGVTVAFVWALYHRGKRLVDSGPNDPGTSTMIDSIGDSGGVGQAYANDVYDSTPDYDPGSG